MFARSRAAIRTASGRSFNYLSTFINGGAARAEGADEDQPADDRHVLQEVLHLVCVLARVRYLPEAMRRECANDRDQCDHPPAPPPLPPHHHQPPPPALPA